MIRRYLCPIIGTGKQGEGGFRPPTHGMGKYGVHYDGREDATKPGGMMLCVIEWDDKDPQKYEDETAKIAAMEGVVEVTFKDGEDPKAHADIASELVAAGFEKPEAALDAAINERKRIVDEVAVVSADAVIVP